MLTYEDDPQYVGISATYALPAGTRRPKAIAEANELTQRSKVAKVYLMPNRGVTISAELFVADPRHLEAVLRLISLVQSVRMSSSAASRPRQCKGSLVWAAIAGTAHVAKRTALQYEYCTQQG